MYALLNRTSILQKAGEKKQSAKSNSVQRRHAGEGWPAYVLPGNPGFGGCVVQRTKASFVSWLRTAYSNSNMAELESNVNNQTFTLKIKEPPMEEGLVNTVKDIKRLKAISAVWREITNKYFEYKADWTDSDKVCIILKADLSEMQYQQEAVYSKKDEGYIEKETKTDTAGTSLTHYMENYAGSDQAGYGKVSRYAEAHKKKRDPWINLIRKFEPSGDTGSKFTAEAGRFEVLFQDEDFEQKDGKEYTVKSALPVTNVINTNNITPASHTVSAFKLTNNYDTVSNWRYLKSLREKIEDNIDINTYNDHIKPVLKNIQNVEWKRSHPNEYRSYINDAKKIREILPADEAEAKSQRQAGEFRKLPITNDEIASTMDNNALGEKSDILIDKSGKELSLKRFG